MKKRQPRLQTLQNLRQEMLSVARGDRPAPDDAAAPSFESLEALARLLTPDNRRLLAIIRDREPGSVSELANITGRSQPNLTRTLAKLTSAGMITMLPMGRRKAPRVTVARLQVDIDPFSHEDRLRCTPA